MLYRRTCLLVEYQEANKALDKAKPQKKAAVSIFYLSPIDIYHRKISEAASRTRLV